MGQIINRNNLPHINLVERGKRTIQNATLSQGLLTDDTVKYSVLSNAVLDIKINDTIDVFGSVYRINSLPSVTKVNNNLYEYEIIGQGLMYDLLRCKFFNADVVGFKTDMEFPLIGDLELFLGVIVNNMVRLDPDWELGTFPANTETKTLTFSGDTCLSALQKICNEYKIDFWIKKQAGKFRIFTGAYGNTIPVNFEYGKGKGLYSLARTNVNDNEVVTRMYVSGGSQNLPSGYRDWSRTLKLPVVDFLEDAALIAQMGLIEGSVEFPDIYPKRTGTITKISDTFKFEDNTMDFDLAEKNPDDTYKYLIPGTSVKVHFNTGNLAGYEFEIKKNGYKHADKSFEIIPFKNEQGQKFPDENQSAFQFNEGDEYVLLDIIMPAVYVENAENELLTKGTEQFNLHKQAKVTYNLDCDPKYIESLAYQFEIGDYVQVKDAALGIDKVLRINSITKNFIENGEWKPFKWQIVIADGYEIDYSSQVILDIKDVKNVISILNLGQISFSKIGLKTTEELKNLIFDTDDYFNPENIKPHSIETNMIAVGAQSQQISLSSVFRINYEGNVNRVNVLAGVLFSQTMDKTWSIGAFNTILPDNDFRYVYARCQKAGTTGEIYLTQDKIKFDESDPTYYYFLVGILHSVVEGVRVLSITIGTTTINGGLIRTGIITSLDGQTSFNLNTGEITGKITFLPGSNAFNQIMVGGKNHYSTTTVIEQLSPPEPVYIDRNHPDAPNGFYLVGHDTSTGGIRIKNVITENGQWTVSFYLRGSQNVAVGFDLDICDLGSQHVETTADNTWKKVKLTVDVTNYGDGSVFNFVDFENVEWAYFFIKDFKVEKGVIATDWTPAISDVDAQILNAQNTANAAQNQINDFSSDNILSPMEKQMLKNDYDAILSEYPVLIAQAGQYSVSTANYSGKYDNLVDYIDDEEIFLDLTTQSAISGVTLRDRFKDYYTAKVALVKVITDTIKGNLYDLSLVTDNFTSISGGLIMSNVMSVGSTQAAQNAFISGVTDDGVNSIRFGAGADYANKNLAPFKVLHSGKLIATNAEITGKVTATEGSFTGSIYSGSGEIGGWTITPSELTSTAGKIRFGTVDGLGNLTDGVMISNNSDPTPFVRNNFRVINKYVSHNLTNVAGAFSAQASSSYNIAIIAHATGGAQSLNVGIMASAYGGASNHNAHLKEGTLFLDSLNGFAGIKTYRTNQWGQSIAASGFTGTFTISGTTLFFQFGILVGVTT